MHLYIDSVARWPWKAALLLTANFYTSPALADSSPPLGGATVVPQDNAGSLESVEGQRPPSADVKSNSYSEDPTGGAYTTPTLLFIPAGALPTWNVRVMTSLDMQGPTAADRLATGMSFGFRPGIGGELGLPAGFTFGAGTNWVGGDPNTSDTPNAFGGLSPYFQLRYHVLGNVDGRGFQLGTSATYKFVGFGSNGPANPQDPGEIEWAVSAQYRQRSFEAGIQGVVGKDFATTDADSEIHAYALYRLIPEFGVGAAGQVRLALVSQPGESSYDVISGAIASLTLGRWQVAGLVGENTIGLNQGQVGGYGQIFATARF